MKSILIRHLHLLQSPDNETKNPSNKKKKKIKGPQLNGVTWKQHNVENYFIYHHILSPFRTKDGETLLQWGRARLLGSPQAW